MAKVFAEMRLWYFEMRGILCVQFLDVCVNFWKKKEAKFWKCVLAREKKPVLIKLKKARQENP